MEYGGGPARPVSSESPHGARGRGVARRGRLDLPFLLLVLIILTVGIIMVLSASYVRTYYAGENPTTLFARQLIFAVIGIVAMLICSLLPMTLYRRFSIPLLVFSVAALVLVLLIGTESNGGRRWIDLGFTTFQPSEAAKLAVILSFAAIICRSRATMETFRGGVLPFGGILAVILALLVCEPHFSCCIIIAAIGFLMMFLGGTKPRYLLLGALAVAILGVVAFFLVDYVKERVMIWLDPFSELYDGFQVKQSLYAVGSGGVLGLGLGQSRQKYLYLPEEHNDFIFSVVCEELGFVGAALILILFAMLVIRGFWLAVHARDRYGALVVAGITALLAVQVFLNVAVVTNLMPCTGISLPFFSYGGTALVFQLCEMGIVLSASRDIRGAEVQERDRGTETAYEREG